MDLFVWALKGFDNRTSIQALFLVECNFRVFCNTIICLPALAECFPDTNSNDK